MRGIYGGDVMEDVTFKLLDKDIDRCIFEVGLNGLKAMFGILKGHWCILKTGICLHGVEVADKIWKTAMYP